MQLETFTLSDALRDRLQQAVEATQAYRAILAQGDAEQQKELTDYERRQLAQGELDLPPRDRWQDIVPTPTADHSTELFQAAERLLLFERDQLPVALQEEALALCNTLYGIASGYETPAMKFANLPAGMPGFMVARALTGLAMHANGRTAEEKLYPNTLRHQRSSLYSHVNQSLHRESDMPSLQALFCVDEGPHPVTNAIVDVDEFIDAIARRYQAARRKQVFDPAAPIDENTRALVTRAFCSNIFRVRYVGDDHQVIFAPYRPILLDESRRQPQTKPVIDDWDDAHRLLQPLPAANDQAWPKPLRFAPDFAAHVVEELLVHDGLAKVMPEMKLIAAQFQDALQDLKNAAELRVHAQEMLLFNDSFVMHGVGHMTPLPEGLTEYAPPGERPRHMTVVQVLASKKPAVQDHGFMRIADAWEPGQRGRG